MSSINFTLECVEYGSTNYGYNTSVYIRIVKTLVIERENHHLTYHLYQILNRCYRYDRYGMPKATLATFAVSYLTLKTEHYSEKQGGGTKIWAKRCRTILLS